MGDRRDPTSQPVHTVTLSSFSIMDKEVTNAQFDAFRRLKRGEYTPNDRDPVGNVLHSEALAFARWLGKRDGRTYSLPTEAQWEYAARGGLEGADFPWGNSVDQTKALMGESRCKPVGSYPPNAYGLYDMAGNVGEMVRDGDYEYSKQSEVDPLHAEHDTMHMVRGFGVNSDFPWIWFRIANVDNVRDPEVGFRLVIVEPKAAGHK